MKYPGARCPHFPQALESGFKQDPYSHSCEAVAEEVCALVLVAVERLAVARAGALDRDVARGDGANRGAVSDPVVSKGSLKEEWVGDVLVYVDP